MILYEPAIDDVAYVLRHLCPAHAEEHEALGVDYDAALSVASEFLATGDSRASAVDGKPAAVFGVLPDKTVWFIATKAFFAQGMAAIRQSRRFLREMADKHGPLTGAPVNPPPEAEKWLKVLGYQKVVEKSGSTVFRFA